MAAPGAAVPGVGVVAAGVGVACVGVPVVAVGVSGTLVAVPGVSGLAVPVVCGPGACAVPGWDVSYQP
ncbi:MAG TPA: hypothetical protein VKZ89_04200 [Thermobifida alba]|nr:hypothetical protein [Thermobifida alba]